MNSTAILGLIAALLLILVIFQTAQLVTIYNKISGSSVLTQIPNGQTPTQLPSQRGGC